MKGQMVANIMNEMKVIFSATAPVTRLKGYIKKCVVSSVLGCYVGTIMAKTIWYVAKTVPGIVGAHSMQLFQGSEQVMGKNQMER